MIRTKQSLLNSITALILCISMLLGTTFAWFTDVVTSDDNIIQTGKLDIGMEWSENNRDWYNTEGPDAKPIFENDKWEPGHTEVRYIKVTNDGSLAFKYQMVLEPNGTVGKLAEVIDVSYDIVTGNDNFKAPNVFNKKGSLSKVGTLKDLISGNGAIAGGVILPNGETKDGYISGEIVVCISLQMQKTAGNEYQNSSIGTTFDITLYATQYNFESDSFGNNYDADAEWPEIPSVGNSAYVDVDTDAHGRVANATSIIGTGMKAEIPAGVQLAQNNNRLVLNVANKTESEANVTLGENDQLRALDVHVLGIDESNDVPMAITLYEALPVGLNIGNYTIHHVEDGVTYAMIALDAGETPVHNNFTYDPATGDVTLYLASFSEIALVAEPAKWEGKRDYSWYDASKTELYISNADQLAGLGAIVGNMAKTADEVEIDRDSFNGKTIKLLADIRIGDTNEYYTDASENGIVFYPIGYWNDEGTYEKKQDKAISSGFYTFEGTFDGNGHTISDWYQNTWEMKGDHDWYAANDQHYRDGMGLFGRVYGGTVKNLTVKNFSSDGEITTTGTIAAYADFGATFENIAIINCNPCVYNIGNGGIVGCVGWYTKAVTETPVTFRNITVDNSNKISALWGSYDVACGGIVGQYYPTSGQSSAGYPVNAGIYMENCHVGAQMDVYNDVCANYQYYAYRYAGMLIGSVRENETIDGRVYPKMDGITAVDCTVHFGDWNDYYYCELVANTTASYTHDHQMSRLTQVASVDVENMKIVTLDGEEQSIPTSGRVNYVVVKNKDANGKFIHGDGDAYATCYHFVDGAVWNHADAGYHDGQNGEKYIDENGDGWADLKEDKKLIYREFDQLITGYGWGVTSKGIGEMAGVAILDRDQASSVEKFESDVTTLVAGKTYTLGEIFSYISDCGVKLVPGSLAVGVTNLDENGNVTSVVTYDRTNWENGTITLTGAGNVRISIQDYYFCTVTSIDVKVGDGTTSTEHSFDASRDVTLGSNKEAIAEGTTYSNGYFTIVGTVTQRVSSGAVSSVEVAKNGNGAIQFTVTGTATVEVQFSSTGISNTSAVGIVDANGNLVANNEGITEVTGASDNKTVVTYNLSAGTYRVLSPDSDYGRGARVFYINVIETTSGGGDVHTHSYTSSVTTAATCTTAGVRTYTCTCGDSYTEEIAATGHNYSNGTCTVCGAVEGTTTTTVWEWYRTGKSTFGGDPDNFDTTASSNNSQSAVTVTTKNGESVQIEYNTKLSKGNSITIKTNKAGTLEIVYYASSKEAAYTIDGGNATALTTGNQTLTVELSELADGQSHVFTSTTKDIYVFYVSFTFESTSSGGSSGGDSGDTTCQHTNTTTTTVDATCTTDGSTTVKCSDCGATVRTETIKATGHSWNNGICSVCSATQTVVGSEVHNFTTNGKTSDFYSITGNLSTSKGTVTYEGLPLTQCLKIESSTNIGFTAPSAGTLTLVFAESAPTIKVDGTKINGSGGIITVDVEAGTHTLTKADVANLFYMVYTPSNIHTHSYTETIITPATCTTTGLKTLTCSCGDTSEVVIGKLPHNYVETVTKDSTCTEVGEMSHVCSDCGSSYIEEIPMVEHTWSGGSCTEGMTCSVCHTTKPASGHTYAAATCTAPMTCSVCGATDGEALGHSWKDATCTSPKKCTRCGITEGAVAAHAPGVSATCATAQTCTVCSAVLAVALGHNYDSNNKCTRCYQPKPSASFKAYDGWFETAYAEWADIEGATGYNVYVTIGNTNRKIDDALVRKTNGYWRADAVGLTAGTYQLTVVPTNNGSEMTSDKMVTDVITVLAYDRSGYAHYNYTEGVGAYNDDGTLKDNAIVIYVTNENKNTVSVTSKDGTTVVGIGNILGSTGMDVGTGFNSKGGKPNTNQDILRKLAEDGTPLVVRIIGSIKGASSTNLSSATSEIDGLTQYDGVDYGGTAGDNGFMARMSGGKNITIEGIGPDATIDGWGIHFICQTADYAAGYGRSFEVRNITFKNVPEDCIGMEGQQDGSTLTAPVERCWIHNCSFIAPAITSPAESDKDGGDGACDFKRGNYFTNSYCYYEGYHKTNLVGSSDSSLQYNLTYHHNYWKNCESRGPLARQANIHMYNNVFDGQTSYAMNPRANAYIFSEYNMFINTKNPVTVTSGGVVKSYNDSFTSCTGDNSATVVTDKSTKVSTSNKYANFDTDSAVSYIPSGDYILHEDHAQSKAYVMAYAGVMKQNILGPDEVDVSVIPENRRPTTAVNLDYSQYLNKSYVSANGTKDNILFNVSKFNADSLTVGGTTNGCDIVFYVNTTFNVTMTEISGTYSPVLCNEAGVAIITGSGSASNLPAGYYFIQSSGYDVGSSKFKEAKIASLTITRAIVCTDHTYTSKVTAPTCTVDGYTTYTCTNCGYSYKDNTTAAKGHTPGAEAKCTTAQTCVDCGTVVANATGHKNVNGKCTECGMFDPATCPHDNQTAILTDPTCTKQGYTTYTCTDCGTVSTGNATATLPHTLGAEATCTTAQICTVCKTVIVAALGHSYNGEECSRCHEAKPNLSFIKAGGWLESAYAEWALIDGANGYRAYVATAYSSSWIMIDNALVRQYKDEQGNSYWRVDAVGLAAGSYQLRVVPVVDGVENNSLTLTTDPLTVAAHDRSGYAFVNGTSSGAYNENGTLKSGTVVVYVTNENKDTVTATIGGQTVTGLANILSKTYTKNMTTSLCIRFIGNITDLTGSGSAFDKGDLLVENNNNNVGITLEGIGEDAVINGFGIRVKNASNIEIRNLAFMNCDSSEGDSVGLQQGNDHIWVHNCDFFYGDAGSDSDQAKGDGQLDTKKSQYVTHSYNHFWDGGKVHLHGNGDTTLNYVSYHHNWYDHCDSRMPRVRVSDSVHVYNNFYDGVSKYGIGATTGCSIFSEANYFLNTARPMMISMQGTDALGEGTFSSENGGMIKSYGDVIVFTNTTVEANCSFIPYSQNNTSFDAYVATSRNEQVSSSITTVKGGTSYSNFDTAAGFYTYNVETAENAMQTVKNLAGRMGDGFTWEWTEADDSDYSVNTALKAALVNYTTNLVSVGGVAED